MSEQKLHATTIIGVYKNDCAAIAGDGQVTFNNATIMKQTAKKVRRLYHGQVIAGFAGSVADAFTLFDKFEIKLEESRGNLHKAAVALAREWRTDKILRTLEAMLIAASKESLLIISGSGEVIEPDNGIAAIGSGGMYALAAARALSAHTDMTAAEIASEALSVAADICVYTNSNIHMETIS